MPGITKLRGVLFSGLPVGILCYLLFEDCLLYLLINPRKAATNKTACLPGPLLAPPPLPGCLPCPTAWVTTRCMHGYSLPTSPVAACLPHLLFGTTCRHFGSLPAPPTTWGLLPPPPPGLGSAWDLLNHCLA